MAVSAVCCPRGRLCGALLAAGTLLPAAGLLPAPGARAATPPAATPLAATLDAALARLGPFPAVALRVVDPGRGTVLYERNPDLCLTPASNQKLLTAAAALAALGPASSFSTRVLSSAEPDGAGTLHGDLVLQGGGDPLLETRDLQALAADLYRGGLRTVRGALRVDDTRYDDLRLGDSWNWDDEPYYYAAQVGALGVNRNVLTLEILPAPVNGAAAEVRVRPAPGYLQVECRARTGERGSPIALSVWRERGRNRVLVSGSVPLGGPAQERRVTCEDPDLFTGTVFRQALEARGIRVEGELLRGTPPGGARELARHASPPLAEIVARLNKPSDNLVAEMLLKELGRTGPEGAEAPGTAARGAALALQRLRALGVPTAGVRIADGSGLSRRNLVTARALTELLARARGEPWFPPFHHSLPVAGVDGTLRRRMRGTPAERRVHAKTGSLSGVSSLSGYARTTGGSVLVFSMLVNNHPGSGSGAADAREVEDHVAAALAALP